MVLPLALVNAAPPAIVAQRHPPTATAAGLLQLQLMMVPETMQLQLLMVPEAMPVLTVVAVLVVGPLWPALNLLWQRAWPSSTGAQPGPSH